MSEREQIVTGDGVGLEAKIDAPEQPRRVTVFCHADPRQGGTMNSPLMIAVTRRLVERGHLVVRFNFRGTGASTGTHGGGVDELADLAAAVDHARHWGLPLGLAGWSFGAAVALTWHASAGDPMPYAGIAPPPHHLPAELSPGPKRMVVGTRDQVIDADALRVYAAEKGIDLVMTPGDHFFHGRGERIGDLVGQGLET
jgi:alpha/beta superfamily hydrolase